MYLLFILYDIYIYIYVINAKNVKVASFKKNTYHYAQAEKWFVNFAGSLVFIFTTWFFSM